MELKTIGFFGDSFCELESNKHSIDNGYKTYIQQLKEYYNLEIVNMGMGGSSVWDVVINQLGTLIKNNKVPDVCVFSWTHSGKLFHRKSRSLHYASVFHGNNDAKFEWFAKEYPDAGYNFFDKEVYATAKQYFIHLYDQEKSDIEHLALMQYIDNNILNTLTNTKIVHLWSFGSHNFNLENGWHPDNIKYPYVWKNGATILPALMSLSMINYPWPTQPAIDDRPNHIEGDKNNTVFEWIKYAIETGETKDYSSDIIKRWNEK
jgi:hypothetical protein